jgi:hypothetical protein
MSATLDDLAGKSGHLVQCVAGRTTVYPVTIGPVQASPEPEPYIPPDFDRMRRIADALGGQDGAFLHAMIEAWEDER